MIRYWLMLYTPPSLVTHISIHCAAKRQLMITSLFMGQFQKFLLRMNVWPQTQLLAPFTAPWNVSVARFSPFMKTLPNQISFNGAVDSAKSCVWGQWLIHKNNFWIWSKKKHFTTLFMFKNCTFDAHLRKNFDHCQCLLSV